MCLQSGVQQLRYCIINGVYHTLYHTIDTFELKIIIISLLIQIALQLLFCSTDHEVILRVFNDRSGSS